MGIDEKSAEDALEIEGRIIAFIEHELLSRGETVTREDDLLSGEIFDSIGVLRLAAFVGEDFQIDMQPADFVVENFQNVAVLAEYVQRSVRKPGASPAEPGP